MKTIMKSIYLYEVQIAQTKLDSRGIQSFLKNEFVNNVAVMPVAENYMLVVDEKDFDRALEILQEKEDFSDSSSDSE